ncbi:excalibur calcium-binding domain-containing protein [Pseudomonas sp. NW5]|uniref:excalibur calcium-binding domain-containing protein n=1 Tax=Pseudomonas sp. NW5 TaxID=2934934 RepID=UPI0024C4BC9A|nr:excalibur calcium-binding domain-containing protein [Pseudomonas sp. NW5]
MWSWAHEAEATRQYPRTDRASSGHSCSTRKTCGQMASCAEARYQLEQCGNGRLDRDGDGVPCESLFRQ